MTDQQENAMQFAVKRVRAAAESKAIDELTAAFGFHLNKIILPALRSADLLSEEPEIEIEWDNEAGRWVCNIFLSDDIPFDEELDIDDDTGLIWRYWRKGRDQLDTAY